MSRKVTCSDVGGPAQQRSYRVDGAGGAAEVSEHRVHDCSGRPGRQREVYPSADAWRACAGRRAGAAVARGARACAGDDVGDDVAGGAGAWCDELAEDGGGHWVRRAVGIPRRPPGRAVARGNPGPTGRHVLRIVRPCPEADGQRRRLKVENGRKTVKSAPYRPILSANRRGQRPTAVYAQANPAPNGQNGGKLSRKVPYRRLTRVGGGRVEAAGGVRVVRAWN